MLQKYELSLDDAKKMIEAARAQAQKMGLRVSIAVVDDGGHCHCLERLDGASKPSPMIAIEKARTAALFQRPTKVFEDVIVGGRSVLMALPGLTAPVEGGLPILVEGQCVGAIAASGAKSPEDAEIAQAGLNALTS